MVDPISPVGPVEGDTSRRWAAYMQWVANELGLPVGSDGSALDDLLEAEAARGSATIADSHSVSELTCDPFPSLRLPSRLAAFPAGHTSKLPLSFLRAFLVATETEGLLHLFRERQRPVGRAIHRLNEGLTPEELRREAVKKSIEEQQRRQVQHLVIKLGDLRGVSFHWSRMEKLCPVPSMSDGGIDYRAIDAARIAASVA